MDTVRNTGLNSQLYWQEETVPVVDGSEQTLKQEDFFALLTEQLSNQDPTKPVDNDQLVAQMTSYHGAMGRGHLTQSPLMRPYVAHMSSRSNGTMSQ